MKKTKFDRIYLVVPRIIEQPTWGGGYILQNKGWSRKSPFQKLKIGQSYELFSGSRLDTAMAASDDPEFTGELGYAMEPDKFHFASDAKRLIKLSEIINRDPLGTLGKAGVKKFGKEMKILIKFTQAKGNSFQLHVKESARSDKWHFKPESWYYFEPGLLTLGAKKNINWKAYQAACNSINDELRQISEQITAKKISLTQGKAQAQIVIKKYNPWKFVNTIKARKDELIDLSSGGLHHSWEESPKFPRGNIVYELCYDVMDPISSVRVFDKGKLKADGSLRSVAVNDYFRYVDRSTRNNNPDFHKLKPKILANKKNVRVESLLKSKYYCMDKLVLKSVYAGKETATGNSFHHLFMKTGSAWIKRADHLALRLPSRQPECQVGTRIKLTQGHSCFIPAAVKNYIIQPIGKNKIEILKTFIK